MSKLRAVIQMRKMLCGNKLCALQSSEELDFEMYRKREQHSTVLKTRVEIKFNIKQYKECYKINLSVLII